MWIKAAIAGALTGVIGLMGLSLYLLGNSYLAQRDKATTLQHTLDINELAREYEEKQEHAIASLRAAHDDELTTKDLEHKEQMNEITRKLISARDDALQKPIQFGDDLFRNFIRVDCLYSLGATGNSVEGRKACRREAQTTEPSSQGLSVAVITPTFRNSWSEGCDAWNSIGTEAGAVNYTKEDWRAEYGTLDPAMCDETLVAMTPEAAIFFEHFLENSYNYTSQLLSYATEQNELIDLLTKPENKDEQVPRHD